jgi:hypothetical protein
VDGIAGTGDDEVNTANAALMQFKVVTVGLAGFPKGFLSVDIGRSMTARTKWIGASGATKMVDPRDFFSTDGSYWYDVVNDDTHNDDEDTDLRYIKNGMSHTTQNVYVCDAPGTDILTRDVAADSDMIDPATGKTTLVISTIDQFNAFEFVRIKIGGLFTLGNGTVEGSRSSVYFYWHNRMRIDSVMGGAGWREWVRTAAPAGDNSIGTGNKAITI